MPNFDPRDFDSLYEITRNDYVTRKDQIELDKEEYEKDWEDLIKLQEEEIYSS